MCALFATNVCTLIGREEERKVFLEMNLKEATYDTTKAIKHLSNSCSGGGKDLREVIAYKVATEASKKGKVETVSGHLEQYHAERGAAERGDKGSKKPKRQQNIKHMMDPQSYRARALCAQAHFFL